MTRTKKSKKPFERLKHADARRVERRRDAIIESLANSETFPKNRARWHDVIPFGEHPDFPKDATTAYDQRWLWRTFSREEIDEIERTAMQRRLGRYGGKVVRVLDRLYDLAIDSGDVTAAKEFLNRLLGQSKQQIVLEHETGDNLTQLLQSIRASDAYSRPKIDSDGNEIIEIEQSDYKQIETNTLSGETEDAEESE